MSGADWGAIAGVITGITGLVAAITALVKQFQTKKLLNEHLNNCTQEVVK